MIALPHVENCNLCHGSSRKLVFTKDGFDIARCTGCGLLYVLNPFTEARRAKYYSFDSGYHGELAGAADSIARHTKEAQRNLCLLARHAQSGRLLDIGCSTGLFLDAARTRGWTTRGLEYSTDSARVARERFGLFVEQGELRRDQYAADSFDVVTMWDVIEHVPDPRQTVEIVREILSPGGLLVLKTPNADGLFPRVSLAVAHLLKYWGHPEPPGHLFQFSTATLSRLLDVTGFDVLKVYYRRIPMQYSFGTLHGWFRSPMWLAYCLTFAPIAILGPWLRQGDDITLVARKRS